MYIIDPFFLFNINPKHYSSYYTHIHNHNTKSFLAIKHLSAPTLINSLENFIYPPTHAYIYDRFSRLRTHDLLVILLRALRTSKRRKNTRNLWRVDPSARHAAGGARPNNRRSKNVPYARIFSQESSVSNSRSREERIAVSGSYRMQRCER